MNIGDRVYTDRFCTVTIKEIFNSRKEAAEQGYTENAYYDGLGYVVVGRSIDMYHMEFAAYRK